MSANGGRPRGVAVQMHAYISSPPVKSDNSALRVKDGKQIEIVGGSTGETLNMALDHVYQQATDGDVMERSLRSLTAACVEGVNVSLLAMGSAKSQKSRVLFSPMPDQSVAASVFQTLLDLLQDKVASVSNDASIPGMGGTTSSGYTSAKKIQALSSATFSMAISFVELYEETIMDLLATINGSTNKQPLIIEDDLVLGKTIKNLTQSPLLSSLGNFRRLLDAGLSARRSSNGLYGNATEFSSAILRISVRQVFTFHDASTQELHSVFDIVDLPATNKLSRPGTSVRLSEGPLLNKSLFALQEVVESLSSSKADGVSVHYQASQLTTLLQDALGGNCLTLVLMCLSPGDLEGSAATLQLGRMLPHVQTFPMVNNDMLRGLQWRQHLTIKQETLFPGAVEMKEPMREGKQGISDYERRLHDLEGKLAQSGLERRVLREDKDALTAQLSELRVKYRELFDNELSLRTELLACEQEKLVLSKAFVAFQLERDTQVQHLDSDKFEAETRLLKAEQLVVEIQRDDATKAAQIQDLCVKMNELVADKTRLGGELAMLQKATKAAEQARDAESKKNQQLSLELIVAVNQRQKLQGEMETLATQFRARKAEADKQEAELKKLHVDNEALREQATAFEAKFESMRKDVVRRELDLERAELAVKKEQLETQQAGRDADHKREHSTKLLGEEMEEQRAAFTAGKRSLELQLERVQQDLTRETREKQQAAVTLNAKNEENEELLLALERGRHDLQAQLEAFRLKLALLHQSDSGDRGNQTGAGIRALKELLASYQLRERELHSELDSARNSCLRMARRLRDPFQHIAGSLREGEDNIEKNGGDEDDNEHQSEGIDQLREHLAAAEQQIAEGMNQLSEQALIIADLEANNTNLTRELEKQQQQIAPSQSNDSGVRAIAEMHAALTRQLEEVRRLTLQQQQSPQNLQPERATGRTVEPSSSPNSPTQNPVNANELESLRAAKAQLESRLSNSKAHWMALLEQVERRCAELLTKNVMLTEDNESLRHHLTKAHKAHHQQQKFSHSPQ